MQPSIDPDALKFIELAQTTPFDPYLAFLLKLPDVMKSRFPLCIALRELCDANQIKYTSTNEATRHTFIKESFFQTIKDHLAYTGVDALFPSSFVVAKSKADVLGKYNKNRDGWGIHMGFFFQAVGADFGSADSHGSLFFIFRSWRDALIYILSILKKQYCEYKGQKYPVLMVIEHVLEDAPHYAMFDCDQQLSRFQDRITEGQIKEATAEFPREIYTKLVESEAVWEETTVSFQEKDKSREGKVSYHFCSTLLGFKDNHTNALSMALQSSSAWLGNVKEYVKKHKTYECLTEEDLKNPILSFDEGAAPGGANGFLTLFSRKNKRAPYPAIRAEQIFCGGGRLRRVECDLETPHDPSSAHLTDLNCLWMLMSTCYTIIKNEMAFYALEITNKKPLKDKVS